MKVFIKKIWASTVYMDQKSDYMMLGKLDNGMLVELLDVFDSTHGLKSDQKIDCLILAFHARLPNEEKFSERHNRAKPIFTGSYLGEVPVPRGWKRFEKKFEETKYPTVQTVNGKILVDFLKDQDDLKVGDIITFREGRLDLLDWKLIE
jgi:hypothetical protein